jgi:hypothetical protein
MVSPCFYSDLSQNLWGYMGIYGDMGSTGGPMGKINRCGWAGGVKDAVKRCDLCPSPAGECHYLIEISYFFSGGYPLVMSK